MPRSWTRAAQFRSERPQDPLTAHCATHRPRRTTIRREGGWWCLACSGCPRCGAHQIWEQIEEDDAGLFRAPITLEGRLVRGDWWCLRCGEWIVKWAEYRRQRRNWLAGRKAEAEGYKRRDEAA
jgi:hypothetical protein